MTLTEAFSKHLIRGQQGQLVIKLVGEIHLCKILIEDGTAVHISLGRAAPDQIIHSLKTHSMEWVKFIAGYPVRKKLDYPLHQELLSINGSAAAAPIQADPIQQSAAPQQAEVQNQNIPQNGPTLPAEKVAAVVDGFIDLVGPLGSILADQAASGFNYTNGSPMPEACFNGFIQELAKEIPEADRSAFIEQYSL